jgi:hypothetical protein
VEGAPDAHDGQSLVHFVHVRASLHAANATKASRGSTAGAPASPLPASATFVIEQKQAWRAALLSVNGLLHTCIA